MQQQYKKQGFQAQLTFSKQKPMSTMLSNATNDNVASLKEIPNHVASKDLFEKSKKKQEEMTEI